MGDSQTLLSIDHVTKHYPVGSEQFGKQKLMVRAVDDVTFTIRRGETLGLVGESGCGKSTIGRIILNLEKPTDGTVWFDGRDISLLSRRETQAFRSKLQIIFQDPYSSLNPRKSVASIIGEGMIIHGKTTRRERDDRVREYLQLVGLSEDHLTRYPHEFSGGQRQRIGVARALALDPDLIVADEPVSALDVSIQAQILNLMIDLKEKLGLTYLFISHDLSVVEYISDRVAVMYLGKIVEFSEKTLLYADPLHPYTTALLSAVPAVGASKKTERIVLSGDIPNPIFPPPGCRFHTRCPEAQDVCKKEEPPLEEKSGGRWCACHFR
ncbi:MAG: dipeptide ABC transporter ATP-binding protein [Deltaproteobacteria bacterium]|nr:dipeptide ABC transporter ATP-binding protein [Candidatus Zymogenaceae bacterium]